VKKPDRRWPVARFAEPGNKIKHGSASRATGTGKGEMVR
jgi:hypothetical protein